MSLVSVIMPVHDTAPYLEASLSSVLRQSMEDIEIILAENLSTDGSYEMCDALAEKDSRIRVLHLDRAGLSNARNEGIRHASSDYLVFIDSDDVIEPQMLEKLYSAATQYGADIAVCNYDWVFSDGTSKKPYREGKDPVFMDTVAFTYAILTEQVCSSACVGLYRKDMFGDGRIWFPVDRFYEDRATTYRLAAAAVNGGVLVPESMYHYIQREGSICHTMDFKKFFQSATTARQGNGRVREARHCLLAGMHVFCNDQFAQSCVMPSLFNHKSGNDSGNLSAFCQTGIGAGAHKA